MNNTILNLKGLEIALNTAMKYGVKAIAGSSFNVYGQEPNHQCKVW